MYVHKIFIYVYTPCARNIILRRSDLVSIFYYFFFLRLIIYHSLQSLLDLDVYHIRVRYLAISSGHLVRLQSQCHQFRHRHHIPGLEHQFPCVIGLRTRIAGQIVGIRHQVRTYYIIYTQHKHIIYCYFCFILFFFSYIYIWWYTIRKGSTVSIEIQT